MECKKTLFTFFILICLYATAHSADLKFYLDTRDEAPTADFLFLYPEPVYRIVDTDEEMHISFQLIDVNAMIGIDGFTYLPGYVKTNVFGFWISPTLYAFTIEGKPIPIFKLNEIEPFLKDWNSLLLPKSGEIIDLKIPRQGPGIYSLYIAATDNGAVHLEDLKGFKSLEKFTIEVVDPGESCQEMEEAMSQIRSEKDIPKFYSENLFYYKWSLDCCTEGCESACWARSACETLNRKRGMCQDFTVLNSAFLSNLNIKSRPVAISQETGPGHAVTVFVKDGKFYMLDNMALEGPASNLKDILDMNKGATNWNGFFILDSPYQLMEGRVYGPYMPKAKALFIKPDNFFAE